MVSKINCANLRITGTKSQVQHALSRLGLTGSGAVQLHVAGDIVITYTDPVITPLAPGSSSEDAIRLGYST